MRDHPLISRLEARAARAVCRLPDPLLVRLSRRPPVRIDGQTLAPDIQAILALRKLLGSPALSGLAPPEGRRAWRRDARVHAGRDVRVKAVRAINVAGADGRLPARHYLPDATGARPLLVFFHGGGFVLGDLDTHDVVCRLLCRDAGLHVLSVDYRLAPEHPFPAAVDDARAAFAWAAEHARELGADPARILVGGDSAGGTLAAVTAQRARREGGPRPCAQVLLYPTVDRTRAWPSMALFAEDFILTRADVDWFTALYLGDRAQPADPRVSPLCANDLSSLPPALVVTAGFDPLRDEGEAYAHALESAGTPATLHRFAEQTHGFLNLVGPSPSARRAAREVAARVRMLVERA